MYVLFYIVCIDLDLLLILQNNLHPWSVYMYFVYSNYAVVFAEIVNSQYAGP